MTKAVKFKEMLTSVRSSLAAIPEHRKGHNTQYEIEDAGLSAFSVFYLQSPSFLAYQQQMREQQGQDNAKSLFGIENIPGDAQIRKLLDPTDPSLLGEPFWEIYGRVRDSGHLDSYRHVGGTFLCSIDGTRYFSSEKIHCDNCTVYESDDLTDYAHMVVAAVLSVLGQPHVLALEPEFIVPQDRHDKQDCEQEAIKRWVKRNAKRFEPWEVTILADDLHSHQPLCTLLLENNMHFIMVCKPESHETLYQEIELLAKVEGANQTKMVRRWKRGHYEQWHYHWVSHVPLRTGTDALHVNWCEVTVIREDTGKQVYYNTWITDHKVTVDTVEDIADA
ncbi:MAG: ISNCY family transposase, partial [Anaerolineae bacterium]